MKEIDGEILCVSQFTLMGSTTKNKPDFHKAMVSVFDIVSAVEGLTSMRRVGENQNHCTTRYWTILVRSTRQIE